MFQFRPYLLPLIVQLQRGSNGFHILNDQRTGSFSAEHVGWQDICWFVLANASKFKLKTLSVLVVNVLIGHILICG